MPCAQPPGDAGSCPGGEKCHCFSPPPGLHRLSLKQLSRTWLLLLAAVFPCSRICSLPQGQAWREQCQHLPLLGRQVWMCPGLSHPPKAADPELACVSSRHALAVHAPVPRTKKKKQQRVKRRARRGVGARWLSVASPCLSLRPSPHQRGCVGVSCGKPAAARGNTTMGVFAVAQPPCR